MKQQAQQKCFHRLRASWRRQPVLEVRGLPRAGSSAADIHAFRPVPHLSEKTLGSIVATAEFEWVEIRSVRVPCHPPSPIPRFEGLDTQTNIEIQRQSVSTSPIPATRHVSPMVPPSLRWHWELFTHATPELPLVKTTTPCLGAEEPSQPRVVPDNTQWGPSPLCVH